MYLNGGILSPTTTDVYRLTLTLTWDVFKCRIIINFSRVFHWLTLTWDVFKLLDLLHI